MMLSLGQYHPVLLALGGPQWFDRMSERKKVPFKEEERATRACGNCGIGDVQAQLFRCSRCEYNYYW